MAEQVRLAIAGAGPAGLAAAIEAAEGGVPATLIDMYPRPGGQFYKQIPAQFEIDAMHREHYSGDEGRDLLSKLESAGTRVLSDTVVWGIFPDEGEPGYLLCLYGAEGTARRIVAEKVILAPGAYDRPLPFAGWTLPGVMTAGAAQVLVKSQRVLPGQRILLSGTGPLQLALASQLVSGGAEVVAILDANPFPWSGWRHAAGVWGQWERLREGWEYWRTIRQAGVSLRWGQTVIRAEGDGRVEQAVIGPVNGGGSETLAVDTICLGFGFVPAVQLPAQAGCGLEYRSESGCYVPRRDEWLQTTLPGLFVAGDGAGIGGKDVAMWEGRLAAMAATAQLGYAVAGNRTETARRELARQKRFADVLERLFPFPPALWRLMTDDTILCRCEEITLGEVRRAVADGATTPTAVKGLTRAGMGRCQGRMCYGAVAHVAAQQTGEPIESMGALTTRPPVLPVPLEGLLEEVR
jgi:NADPH-dependent 2,4-dienoyl-CoA reductase/sulfur reductase-like enzyme